MLHNAKIHYARTIRMNAHVIGINCWNFVHGKGTLGRKHYSAK